MQSKNEVISTIKDPQEHTGQQQDGQGNEEAFPLTIETADFPPRRQQISHRGQCLPLPHTILTLRHPCWTASAGFPGILRSSACWALSSAAGSGQPQQECPAQILAQWGTALPFQVFWGEMTVQNYEFPSIPLDHIWLIFHRSSANYCQYIQSLLTNVPAGWINVASGMCSWIHCSLLKADSFETHLCLFLHIPCFITLPRRSCGCKQSPLPVKQSPATKSSCCWERGNFQKLKWKTAAEKQETKSSPDIPPACWQKLNLMNKNIWSGVTCKLREQKIRGKTTVSQAKRSN